MAVLQMNKIKPVLMILTSPAHPVDTFLLCLRSLEMHTDLRAFEAIYLCANQVGPDRMLVMENFTRRHANAVALHCTPVGHHPCVPQVQNLISEEHHDGVIIKMDDDMYVTPGWLDRLLATYEATRDVSDLAFVTPLVPINTMGAQCLWDFMSRRYGAEFRHMWIRGSGHIGNNAQYHEMIWSKVLDDRLIERFQASLDEPRMFFSGPHGHASINCMMYDARLMDVAYPFPLGEAWFLDGEKMFDESIINRYIRDGQLQGVVAMDAVVHHYAFNRVEAHMREHFPLDRIREYIMALKPHGAGAGEARPLRAATA